MVSHNLPILLDQRVEGMMLSGKAVEVVKKLVGGAQVSQEESGMSKREWREFMAALGRSE